MALGSDKGGMQMNKALIVVAVLLGIAVGVGGYHLVVVSRSKPAAPAPANFATQLEVAEVRKHLAAIEGRLAKAEAKPGIEEVGRFTVCEIGCFTTSQWPERIGWIPREEKEKREREKLEQEAKSFKLQGPWLKE
jgi:hypothetical protein